MSDEPYRSGVDPYAGGNVRVLVSARGWWNVWLDNESYVEWMGDSSNPMEPVEALGVARRLVLAAVVCWWKRLPDQLRGRTTSVRTLRRQQAETLARMNPAAENPDAGNGSGP